MKLPLKVSICGTTYSVRTDRTSYDGCGSTSRPCIVVGTKSRNTERKWEIYLHEVMEVVTCERGYRYGSGGSDGSIFVMSHKEFDNFSRDVAAAVRPMLKES